MPAPEILFGMEDPYADAPVYKYSDTLSLKYVVQEDGSCKIVRHEGYETKLDIPAEIDGHPVTVIGREAL